MALDDEIKGLETLLTSKLNQLLNLYKEKRALEEFIKEKGLTNEYDGWRRCFYQNRGWK